MFSNRRGRRHVTDRAPSLPDDERARVLGFAHHVDELALELTRVTDDLIRKMSVEPPTTRQTS